MLKIKNNEKINGNLYLKYEIKNNFISYNYSRNYFYLKYVLLIIESSRYIEQEKFQVFKVIKRKYLCKLFI